MDSEAPRYDDGYPPSDGFRPSPDPTRALGAAVQRTAAANLGRGFLPLVALVVAGLVEAARAGPLSAKALVLVLGSVATAGTMLAYGQLAVHRAFGHPRRPWMVAASVGGLFPYLFGLYVMVGLGIVPLMGDVRLGSLTAAVFFTGMGAFCLRSHWKLTDLHLFTGEITDLTERPHPPDAILG